MFLGRVLGCEHGGRACAGPVVMCCALQANGVLGADAMGRPPDNACEARRAMRQLLWPVAANKDSAPRAAQRSGFSAIGWAVHSPWSVGQELSHE